MKKLIASMAAMSVLSIASIASAQSTSTATTTGVPNTGVGGDAVLTLAILGGSALLALLAGAYALRLRTQ